MTSGMSDILRFRKLKVINSRIDKFERIKKSCNKASVKFSLQEKINELKQKKKLLK